MDKEAPFLPEAVANMSKSCSICGAVVRPRFGQSEPEQYVPIVPDGTTGEKGAWHRISFYEQCQCGNKVQFEVDHKTLGPRLYLYGDESGTTMGKYRLYSYSVVGGTSGPIRDLSNALYEVKKTHVPDVDPTHWQVHTYPMMPRGKRSDDPVHRRFRKRDALTFFGDIADAIADLDKWTWNVHVAMCEEIEKPGKARGTQDGRMKRTAHNAILSYVIFQSTAQSLRPTFVLEATEPIRNDPHIEDWSYDTHMGSKYFIDYLFLTHSNDIEPPKLVEPRSHPCLELADVHAYWATRNIGQRAQRKSAEIPLSRFGLWRYIAVRDARNLWCEIATDIPDWYLPTA